MLQDELRQWLTKADYLIKNDFDYFRFVIFNNEGEVTEFLDQSTKELELILHKNDFTAITGEETEYNNKLAPILKIDTELRIQTMQSIKNVLHSMTPQAKQLYIEQYNQKNIKSLTSYSISSLVLDCLCYCFLAMSVALALRTVIHAINNTLFNIVLFGCLMLLLIFTTFSNIQKAAKKQPITINFKYAILAISYGCIEYFSFYESFLLVSFATLLTGTAFMYALARITALKRDNLSIKIMKIRI